MPAKPKKHLHDPARTPYDVPWMESMINPFPGSTP